MKIDFKAIGIFTIVIAIIIILIWPTGKVISEVKDGSTVVLDDGVEVHLIGISSTEEGKEHLNRLMIEGIRVNIIPDSKSPFEYSMLSQGDVVYAYIDNNDDGLCINEKILSLGLANIQDDTYLYDRWEKFMKAANGAGVVNPTPTTPSKIDYEGDGIINLPEYKMPAERKHSAWYNNGNMNLDMLNEACDYDLPYTKRFANVLAGKSQGNFNPGQICEIFDYCYKKWRYVNDPKGHEYVARASESIASYLTGDCDDFAVLMASCLLAVGADVCVNTGHNPSGGHAFAEVDISMFDQGEVLKTIQNRFDNFSISRLNIRDANGKKWLNLDWQASYPGGSYYDCSSSWDAYPCIDGVWSWNKLK